MPQLTQRFGPIPQTVVLDGSGNGTVSFQPNGSNARITNLFVKVATSTAQAVCTIYLGTVADSNRINTTNSGSTGATASGTIDVTDGQTVFVVWTGGDVGAVATATFVGVTVPFDEIGASVIDWADPIAAADGSLIYPALKSPNYVVNVSGWKIDRLGNVEFNNATIRGTVTAGGGTVILNNSGITVSDPGSSNFEYLVNRTAGFYARNIPDNGEHTQMYPANIVFSPPDPTPNGNTISLVGKVFTSNPAAGTNEFPRMTMQSPKINGGLGANVVVTGQTSNGLVPPSITLEPFGGTVVVNGTILSYQANLFNTTVGLNVPPAQLFTTNISVTNNNNTAAQQVALGNTNYGVAFPVGSTVYGFANIRNTSGPSGNWVARFLPISNTQYNLFVFNPLGGSGVTTFNLNVDIAVFIVA